MAKVKEDYELKYMTFMTCFIEYKNDIYMYILEFIMDLIKWNLKDSLKIYKNDTKIVISKLSKNYSNDIFMFKERKTCYLKSKYKCSEESELETYILPKNNSNNNSYYHIREINYKLKRVYDLLNCKYKAAIIRIPYFTDIKKLNIKQQYETFLISYENYSYILINIF